eukprot:gene40355-54576_t
MDFAYLARVTAINVATIRRLAAAPAAPSGVTIAGALSFDTTVKWQPVEGAVSYRVHWRRNDAQDWQRIDLARQMLQRPRAEHHPLGHAVVDE